MADFGGSKPNVAVVAAVSEGAAGAAGGESKKLSKKAADVQEIMSVHFKRNLEAPTVLRYFQCLLLPENPDFSTTWSTLRNIEVTCLGLPNLF
jgi:hypothetical protein